MAGRKKKAVDVDVDENENEMEESSPPPAPQKKRKGRNANGLTKKQMETADNSLKTYKENNVSSPESSDGEDEDTDEKAKEEALLEEKRNQVLEINKNREVRDTELNNLLNNKGAVTRAEFSSLCTITKNMNKDLYKTQMGSVDMDFNLDSLIIQQHVDADSLKGTVGQIKLCKDELDKKNDINTVAKAENDLEKIHLPNYRKYYISLGDGLRDQYLLEDFGCSPTEKVAIYKPLNKKLKKEHQTRNQKWRISLGLAIKKHYKLDEKSTKEVDEFFEKTFSPAELDKIWSPAGYTGKPAPEESATTEVKNAFKVYQLEESVRKLDFLKSSKNSVQEWYNRLRKKVDDQIAEKRKEELAKKKSEDKKRKNEDKLKKNAERSYKKVQKRSVIDLLEKEKEKEKEKENEGKQEVGAANPDPTKSS